LNKAMLFLSASDPKVQGFLRGDGSYGT
jgi:hypothetical protein